MPYRESQPAKALRVGALALLWPASSVAHAGNLEAAPLIGALFGLLVGLALAFISPLLRLRVIVTCACLLFVPIALTIFSEPGFPSDIGATLGWLALGFAFLYVPAGLSSLAGFGISSWFKRAFAFYKRSASSPDVPRT